MQFQVIRRYLEKCLTDKMFPGAAAAISFGKKRSIICIGNLSDQPDSPTVDEYSIYDLASLTKPIATTTAILKLIDKNYLSMDQPLASCLDEFNKAPDKKTITIRSLLTHTSGLAAWEPIYVFASSRQKMIAHLAEKPLSYAPGTRVEYSCLGFIILAEIVSRLTGDSLASFCQRQIFDILSMHDTCFNPDRALRDRIAPTEANNAHERMLCEKAGLSFNGWRNYRLHGEVHDVNAWTAGGEGGNAGLFSTVSNVLQFGEVCLDILNGNKAGLLTRSSLLAATRNQTQGLNSHRGLGWQMADSSDSVQGILHSQAFGHNGFTGTSLWIDPISQAVFVLLTNRVYYSASIAEFRDIRRMFHKLVIDECVPAC